MSHPDAVGLLLDLTQSVVGTTVTRSVVPISERPMLDILYIALAAGFFIAAAASVRLLERL
jgi:hypothetical protein